MEIPFLRDKLIFYTCKEYLLTNSFELKPSVDVDCEKEFRLVFRVKERRITLALIKERHAMTIDINDSFYMLRIPRTTFTKTSKAIDFMAGALDKIETSLYPLGRKRK